MNKDRRKILAQLQERLEAIKDEIQSVLEDEEEYRDNMPENLQGSEKYEKADNACDNLSYAVDSLEDVISSLEEANE